MAGLTVKVNCPPISVNIDYCSVYDTGGLAQYPYQGENMSIEYTLVQFLSELRTSVVGPNKLYLDPRIHNTVAVYAGSSGVKF